PRVHGTRRSGVAGARDPRAGDGDRSDPLLPVLEDRLDGRRLRHPPAPRPLTTSARQVDAKREDAVGELPGRVADDGEVLEVELGLGDELLALGPGHWWQRPLLHGLRPFAEPRQHRVDIQLIAHGASPYDATSTRSRPVRSARASTRVKPAPFAS